MTEFEALQNAVNSIGNSLISLHEKNSEDKRKTIKKYFLSHSDAGTISPCLDYEQMNHFILGFAKACKLFLNK